MCSTAWITGTKRLEVCSKFWYVVCSTVWYVVCNTVWYVVCSTVWYVVSSTVWYAVSSEVWYVVCSTVWYVVCSTVFLQCAICIPGTPSSLCGDKGIAISNCWTLFCSLLGIVQYLHSVNYTQCCTLSCIFYTLLHTSLHIVHRAEFSSAYLHIAPQRSYLHYCYLKKPYLNSNLTMV